MDVLSVLGSRNPEGQTARAAGALLEGLVGAGWQGEQVFLPLLRIERCRQCGSNGWGICRSKGQCVIEDDFAELARKIRAADAVAFVTPVYFGDLSESIRAFLDRLRRTCRQADHREGIANKIAIGICVAGGGGGGAPSCAVSLEKVLSRCGFDVIDMVPVRRQNLELKQEALIMTGRWLAAQVPEPKGA